MQPSFNIPTSLFFSPRPPNQYKRSILYLIRVNVWMLLLTVQFVTALVSVGFFERFVHGVLLMFTRKGRAGARTIISQFLNLFLSIIFGLLSVIVRIVSVGGVYVVWFIVLFVLLSFLHVSYETYPIIWIRGVDIYNESVEPFVQTYIVLPLQIFNIFLKGVASLYNGAIHFFKTIWVQGLLPLIFSELGLVRDMGVTLLMLGRDCSISFSNYLQAASCKTDLCLTHVPELDIVVPMGDVAALAMLCGKLVGNVCGPISMIAEVALFPLVDPKFGEAVHQLVNAVLAGLVYLPIVTGKRCKEFGGKGTGFDILMCTPDLEVVKVYLVGGILALGQVLDNWIAVAFAGVSAQLSGQPGVCDPARTGVTPDTFRDGVLGGDMTTIGLTEWLLATTNGTHAAFFTPGTSSNTVMFQRWTGEGVDVRLGVAAVKYGVANQAHVSSLTQGRQPGAGQTTTLLGCRYVDSLH